MGRPRRSAAREGLLRALARCLRPGRLLPAALGALVVSLALAAPAAADPSLGSRRAEARRVLDEIEQLDARLERTVEAYNGATVALERIRAEARAHRRRLAVARASLRLARRRLATRVHHLYLAEEAESTIDLLLGVTGMDDLAARLDALRRIAEEDATVLAQVRAARREVARRVRLLRRAEGAQAEVVAERAEAEQRIERALADRERLLSSIRGEIARLQAGEERRQELLRRQARARLSEQARAQRRALVQTVVGASAETPEGASVAPPSRYAGVVPIAMRYLGVPYRWGGASPETGFDCSGLVVYVFAQVGVSLPHYAASIWGYGVPVPRGELQPGDLVFFNNLSHMGIFIGDGRFIHAPRTGDVVKISSLSEPWYRERWVGARRLL